MTRTLLLGLALPFLTVGQSARADVTSYGVESDAGRIAIKTGKSGFLGWTGAGHEHDILARDFSGTILADLDQPGNTRATLTIQAASLEVVDEMDPDDVAKIQEKMETDILAIDEHARISFTTERITGSDPIDGGHMLEVKGSLTLRGVTRPVEVLVELVEIEPGAVRASGSFEIKQKDFGIDPVSVGLGAVKVKNELTITFALIGVAEAEQAATVSGRPEEASATH